MEMAREHRPDIILMDINMPGVDGIAASQAIARSVPSAQIIIMSVQSESDYLRRAMLAGARDFLMKPFSGDELITAVRRVHQMRPATSAVQPSTQRMRPEQESRPAPIVRQAHVVSVYSPKGGVGCTTVAINLAVALQERGYDTLLVDGSLQFGDVEVMLNLRATTSIADLMDRLDDVDADLIGSVVVSHESGLRVLLAPPRPEMADLVNEEKVKTVLAALRDSFDYIVIDTSSTLNDVALAMLDTSERIVLITEQNLPTLKNVSRFFDLVGTLEYDWKRILLVVNRVSDRKAIALEDVSKALKRPVVATIPQDIESATRAADNGLPLVYGSSRKRAIANALRGLADLTVAEFEGSVEESGEVETDQAPLVKRLFGLGRSSQALS
jgi:pilus assembly protein CpaE